MSTANQRWMAAYGFVSMGVLLVGLWIIAGFVPPPSPDQSLDEIAQRYSDDQDAIRIGLIISLFGATLLMPWAVVAMGGTRRTASCW